MQMTSGDSTKETTVNLAKNITTIIGKGVLHTKGWVISGESSKGNIALQGTENVG